MSTDDTRMSVPYPVPNRDPPYWLALPRTIQARLCQLLTGRAVTQTFLNVIDPNTFGSQCPLGDGRASLDHYVQKCKATQAWRAEIMLEDDLEEFYLTPELCENHADKLLHLLDHSSLGTHSFKKERGQRIQDPEGRFWHTDHTPLTQARDAWDWAPYSNPAKRITPEREGPDTRLTEAQSWVIPDQDFSRKRKLPPLTWAEHARPRRHANPLAQAHLASPERSSSPAAPRSRRVRASTRRRAPPPRILHPPGRPPDSGTDTSDERSDLSDIITYSD